MEVQAGRITYRRACSMDRSEIMEIRKIFTYKEGDMAVGRFCGCFLNTEGKIKGKFSDRLLNRDKNLIHKFFIIYKKTLANNDSDIPLDEEDRAAGGIYQLMEELRHSELDNEAAVDVLYHVLKDSLPVGNYVITLVYCPYDVPVKTTDRQKIDDAGAELFRFILCSVCPVKTTKGSLGYLTEIDKIEENPQLLVVDPPVFGFMYPSFNQRTADTGHVLCYRTEKLDISGQIFSHSAPQLEKKERKISKRTDRTDIQQESDEKDEGPVVIANKGVERGVNLSPSTSAIPSLDTGVLSNDAHYVRERVLDEDMGDITDGLKESVRREEVHMTRVEGGAVSEKPRKRPVKISGDRSLIEKRIINGRTYYLIAAADADID